MKKYSFTLETEQDLADIYDYTTEKWGGKQAEQYLEKLDDRFQLLAENPNLGKSRDEVEEGYRSFPEGKHNIFYQVGDDGIEIIGIPHQSEDVERHFQTRQPVIDKIRKETTEPGNQGQEKDIERE